MEGFEIFSETELAGLRLCASGCGMTLREGPRGKAKFGAGAGVGWWEWETPNQQQTQESGVEAGSMSTPPSVAERWFLHV